MDMRKYSGAAFINVNDVRNGPLQMQIAAVREGQYGKPDLVFESGEVFSVNSTNNRILMRAYGAKSDDWVRKVIELALGTVKFQGESKDTVIVRPLSPPTAVANKAEHGGEADDEIPF
jgi:hypothetical protein